MNATEGLPLSAHEQILHCADYQRASAELTRRVATELDAGRKAHTMLEETPYEAMRPLLDAAHTLFKDSPVQAICWQHDAVSLAVDEFFATAIRRLAWGGVVGDALKLMPLAKQVFVHARDNSTVQAVEPSELLAAVITHASERAYLQALAHMYGLRPEEVDLLIRMNARTQPIFGAIVRAIGQVNCRAYGMATKEGDSLFLLPAPTGDLSLHHPVHGKRIELFDALDPSQAQTFSAIVTSLGALRPDDSIAELYATRKETRTLPPSPPAPSPTPT
jgi:hypothetical protein